MSSSRKKRTVMPLSSAGLMTFYSSDEPGIRVGPEATLGITITFIVVSILLLIFKPV